jgi:hypothetical protein
MSIKVIFGHGCYGNFIASCLYKYNAETSQQHNFDISFDKSGSSHNIREHSVSQFVQCTHALSSLDDNSVLVVANKQHYLDYFDNQFLKQESGNLIEFLRIVIGDEEIKYKIKHFWKNQITHIKDVKLWELREFLSYCINDILNASYIKYSQIDHAISIDTVDLFSDLYSTISRIADGLNIEVSMAKPEIQKLQQTFVNLQQFNNIQIRCDRWTDDIIENIDNESPCLTIFDEAYVQHLLSERGYQLKCDNLDKFPNSKKMHTLVYKS